MVHRVEDDWGPATKVLPTIDRYKSEDLPIIYLDDDRIYRHDLFESLISNQERENSAAIAAHSVSVKRQLTEAHWKVFESRYRVFRAISLGFWNPKRLADGSLSRIAEGFGGVLIRPSFFDSRLFDYPDHLRSVDDIWISGHLTVNRIPIKTLSKIQPSSSPNIIDGRDTGMVDSLQLGTHQGANRFEQNKVCIQHFQDTFGIWK